MVPIDIVAFKPIPASSLPFRPWPGNAAEETSYWGVWLSDWQEGFSNIGKANWREATKNKEPRTKNTGENSYRILQNVIEIPSGRLEVSPYSSRKHIFQKQLLVFRWTSDKKREGEEGENSVENWNEEKDRKEIKSIMKSSSCRFNSSRAHPMLLGSAELPLLGCTTP